MAAKTKFNFVR